MRCSDSEAAGVEGQPFINAARVKQDLTGIVVGAVEHHSRRYPSGYPVRPRADRGAQVPKPRRKLYGRTTHEVSLDGIQRIAI